MAAKMTARQRIVGAIAHGEVDRIPVCPNLMRWMRGNKDGVQGCTCELHQLAVLEKFGFDPLIYFGMYLNHPISSDYVYRPDADGGYRDLPNVNVDIRVENHKDRTVHIRTFKTPDGTLTDKIDWSRPNMGYGDGPNPHREEPLVKSMSDVAALRHLYPKPRAGFTQDLRMFAEMVGERGVVEYHEASNAGSWGMESLGPENMLLCSVADKDLLKTVLRICQDQHIRNLKEVLESGHKYIQVSWFQCGPSVGWSPSGIKEFFLPLIRESVEMVHRYNASYRFQDDGKMADIIPKLVDMGVDVIGALQPPPVGDCLIGEIKKHYGNKTCLFGGLDPIYTFELGTKENVRKATTEYLEQVGDGKGIIVNTAEAFGPETPPESLHEWVKSVADWCRKNMGK